jgi:hypothetical protein
MSEDMMSKDPKYGKRHEATKCIEAVRAHRTFKYGNAWLSRFPPSTTLENVTDAIVNDPIVPVQWAIWLLKNFGDEFDTHCRRRFIEKLSKDNMMEMHAFLIWRDTPWLTDEEDAMLETIWRGKLPTVEDELRRGLHPRKKSTMAASEVE